MLKGLVHSSRSILRQTTEAFTLRTISVALPSRSLYTNPARRYPPKDKRQNDFDDIFKDMPQSTISNNASVQRQSSRSGHVEDARWEAIFAPLMQRILGTDSDRLFSRDVEKTWADREKKIVSTLPQPHTPYTGRSVQIRPGADFAFAFGKLRRILRENNVPRELKLASRHEKPGVKRRRLRSQRWRKRFAHEVRKKVQLVQEIRARGA